MKIKFWGTRGSIPVAEPEMMKYGGHTSCIEVRLNTGELLIFDAGTGIRRLGLELLRDPTFHKHGNILISHCHWDHIQGFPFFAPAFRREYTWTIYGAYKLDRRMEDLLRSQMDRPYFPVKLEQMGSTIKFVEIGEENFHIGTSRVVSRQLNHPEGNLGFRVESGKNIFTYCTDTEPLGSEIDPKVLELAENADILVYDSQYTEEEYRERKGWGHSTWQEALKIAKAARVKSLVLFHHDPDRDDKSIDKLLQAARQQFANTWAAQREMTIHI